MKEVSKQEELEPQERIAIQIFSVSTAMIGVCLTVIGIIQLIIKTTHSQVMADDVLAFANLLFLGATVFSYLALRTRRKDRLEKFENVAQLFFLGGLAMTVVVSIMIVYFLV